MPYCTAPLARATRARSSRRPVRSRTTCSAGASGGDGAVTSRASTPRSGLNPRREKSNGRRERRDRYNACCSERAHDGGGRGRDRRVRRRLGGARGSHGGGLRRPACRRASTLLRGRSAGCALDARNRCGLGVCARRRAGPVGPRSPGGAGAGGRALPELRHRRLPPLRLQADDQALRRAARRGRGHLLAARLRPRRL
jgi:hypothetical protein